MDLICILLLLFQFVFLLRIVFSFFPIVRDTPVGNVRDIVVAITDPAIWPLRRVLPPLPGGMMSFGVAELALLIILSVLIGLVC